MPSYKASRQSEDVMRELTAIIRELKDPRIDPLLSVVRTELASDLGECKVYVSSLSGIDTAKKSVEGLKSASGFVRHELGRRLSLRRSPELTFIADNSIEHGVEISKKLDEIMGKQK